MSPTLRRSSTARLLFGGALLVASAAGSQVDVTVGDLPADSAVTVEIVVTLANPVPAGLDAVAGQGTVSGDNFASLSTDDPDVGGATDPTVTLVDAVPDLGVTKSYSGAMPPFPGDTLPFDLSFVNVGDQGATGVTLVETVPDETTFNQGASTGTWSCADGSPGGTPCTLSLGGLAGGGSGASAVFAVDLNDPLTPGTAEVLNTVSIADDGANGVDPEPGNDSDQATVMLDVVPPTVTSLDTQLPTEDGALTDCETVTSTVTGFTVGFSEEMRDPAGDADPDDVTNPANYLLVGAGPDFTYDTTACGAPAGDDVATPVASVAYDSGSSTATLSFAGPVPDGLQRLLVCGSTTLRDRTGNPLDGDGNGTGGDDLVRSFRVDRGNLFANGHFDCGAEGWTPVSSGGVAQAWDPSTDADDSPESGSQGASVASPSIGIETASIGQCVAVLPGRVDLLGRARLDRTPGSNESVLLELGCTFRSEADCGGAVLAEDSTFAPFADSGGLFLPIGGFVEAPASTVSALCTATWTAPAGDLIDGWLDALTARSTIFADGFESGDTSAWTQTVP
ncbi:MAG: hypothetical protein R2991_13950 [Thermoanaerobaculia bacterium]